MVTSKERAKLRGLVSTENFVCQIGKEGLSKSCVESMDLALKAREVIKVSVLQNCDEDIKSLASNVSNQLGCEIVGIVGRKIILYRFSKTRKTHILD